MSKKGAIQIPALLIVFGLLLLGSFLVSEKGLQNITGLFHGPANSTTCGEVNESLTLTSDVISNGTCFVINTSDIVLDCAGLTISYGANTTGNGAAAENVSNITIKNCIMIASNGSNPDNIGIKLTTVNDSLLLNNTIQTNGTANNFGILLNTSSLRNNVTNNIIRTFGNESGQIGVMLEYGSSNNSIAGNNITTNGTGSGNTGILQRYNEERNEIIDNIISVFGVSDNHGIESFSNITNSTTRNNTISTGGSGTNGFGSNTAIILDTDANNNSVTLNNISTNGAFGGNDGILIVAGLLTSSVQNVVSDNLILTNGTDSNKGIRLDTNANSNMLSNNIIRTQGNESGNYGIYILSSNSNVFISNNITTNGTDSYAINMSSSSSSVFNHTILTNPIQWIFSDGNTHNFTNTTFTTLNGSINFFSNFTMSGEQDITQVKLNVSFNRAFLNSSNLTFLNTSAEITLRGINFTDPKPIYDPEDDGTFVDCPASICQEISFVNNVSVFNVTQFTSYSTNETQLACPADISASTNLTQNLSSNGTCFTITNSDLTLDCAGFTVAGNETGIGINATDRSNVAIKNCLIINFSNNILLEGTNNSFLINNSLFNSSSNTLYITSSNNNSVLNTTVSTTAGAAILLSTAHNNTIANSTVFSNNSYGILLTLSHNNLLMNNTVSVNSSLGAITATLSNFNNIRYANATGNDGSGIELSGSSTNNNITNSVATSSNNGILIASDSNNVFDSVGMGGGGRGIRIQSSSNLLVNNLGSATGVGDGVLFTSSSSGNVLANITGTATSGRGIYIESSSSNNLTNVTASSNTGSAIRIDNHNNNLTNVVISTNTTWIQIGNTGLENNTFTNVTFEGPNGSIRMPFNVAVNDTVSIARLNISSNKAFLNSSNLTFLNMSAEITFRGITSSNPRPIVDLEDDGTFSLCPSEICTELSFNSTTGTYVFNVTHFTSYESEETVCPLDINTPGSYTLDASLNSTGTCVDVDASNVLFDCAGFNLTSTVGAGVDASLVNNVTIRNCLIKDSGYGILVALSNATTLMNNTISNTTNTAMSIQDSSNTTIINNSVDTAFFGLDNLRSNYTSLSGTDFTNGSSRNVLIRNSFNFMSRDIVFNPGQSEIDPSNITVNGNLTNLGTLIINRSTMFMNVSTSNQFEIENNGTLTIESSNITSNGTTYLFISNAGSNLTVQHSSLSYMGINGLDIRTDNAVINNNTIFMNPSAGITLFFANDSRVTNNAVFNTTNGIVFSTAGNNTVTGNTIYDANAGINFDIGSVNLIANNTISNITTNGIVMLTATNNTISNNTITNAGVRGILLSGQVNNNSFIGNSITNTQFGTRIEGGNADNNFTASSIINSTIAGIYLASGESLSIFRNVDVINSSTELNASANTANNTFINLTLSRGNGTLLFRNATLNGSAQEISSNTFALLTGLVAFNSSRVPSFNTSASATLFSIPSSNTTIFFDSGFNTNSTAIVAAGTQCSSSICTGSTYNSTSQIFTFNISHFSSFAMGPGPSGGAAAEEEAPSGGGRRGISISLCRGNWTCSDWNPCQPNGMQTRTCVNNTGCLRGKPAENQSCAYAPGPNVTVPQPIPTEAVAPPAVPAEVVKPVAPELTSLQKTLALLKTPLAISIMTIALLGALGGFAGYRYVLLSRRKAAAPPAEIPARPPIAVYEVRLKELEEYVSHEISEGKTQADVKKALIDAGWPEEVVAKAFEGLKAIYSDEEAKIIRHYIKIGYSKESIVDFLKSKGWTEDKIQHIFRELR